MNSFLLSFEKIVYFFCLIALPITYIIAFASHPNLLDLKPVKNANSWATEFRHNKKLHRMHVLVLGSALLAINIALNIMNQLGTTYRAFAVFGGAFAIIGAVALAADKGALCLVPSAFDTLPDEEFEQLLPGLQTLLDNKGYIGLVRLLILLPIGFIILAVGLIVSNVVPTWQGITLIIGMVFMINPDIDLLSLIGSCFMLISFGGMAWNLL